MYTINIPLRIGENYISFPEYSTSSFKKIFTDSGIVNDIISFSKFDPIYAKFIEINLDFEYIQQGRGYLLVISDHDAMPTSTPTPLTTTNPQLIHQIISQIDHQIYPQITYQGITYTNPMDFNILQSMLFKGYNLVGPDSNIIVPSGWCKVIDATTRIPVRQLYPTKAYFVHYDECQISNISNQYGLSLLVSVAMIIFYINLFRKEAKDAELISKLKEKLKRQQTEK